MKIYITGHAGASGVLKSKPNTFEVVVYTNANYPLPHDIKKNAKDLLHLQVDDVDHLREGYITPTAFDVLKFLDWSEHRDEIMCVCHAGVSRSSSTAYIIGCSKVGPTKAIENLIPLKHFPNRLIVWYGSQILGDEKIWDTFVEWQNAYSGMDPANDFDFPELPKKGD